MQSSSRFGLENVMRPRSVLVVGAGLWLAGIALGGAALAHDRSQPSDYTMATVAPAETQVSGPALGQRGQEDESVTPGTEASSASTGESPADESASAPEMALPEDEVVAKPASTSGVTEMQNH